MVQPRMSGGFWWEARNNDERFEVVTAVALKNVFFWDI
jgi:hypothetical protein